MSTTAPEQALITRFGAAGFIVMILGTEVVTMVVGIALWSPSGSEAPFQLAAYVSGLVLGVWLWARLPARTAAVGLMRWFLILAAALWVLEAGRRLVAGSALNPVWLTVPLLIGLVWVKPPDRADAARVASAMSLVFGVAVIVSVALEAAGVAESWYVRENFEPFRAFDNVGYWIPLSEPLGLDGRWAGPFPHPNMAGPVGGLLIVVGMCRRGWLQAMSLLVGVVVLVLTSSRTGIVGALAGASVVAAAAMWSGWPREWSRRIVLVGMPTFLAGLLGASVALAGYGQETNAALVTRVSDASGRAEVWVEYARLWLESPWLGSPDLRIRLAAQRGEIPEWASTAHNLLLDTLFRFGVGGAIFVVAVLVVAGLMGFRAAAQGTWVGLGLVAVLLGCSLTEALIMWRLFAVSTILLWIAVIASAGDYPAVTGWRSPASARADRRGVKSLG